MRLIEEIKENYNIVSIIGLAKNSGKTVTLDYLIEQSSEYNIRIGLTSTGRDGETIDVVTETDKPLIYVEEGTIIATAKSRIGLAEAKLEILEVTDCQSPMGEIVLCKVRRNGNIQLAGPMNVKDTLVICNKLKQYGSEIVFIDGAIDRKAVSSPLISDACIVVSGAVISRDINKVVEKTAHTINCYSLKEVIDESLRGILNNIVSVAVIDKNYDVVTPMIKTSISNGKLIRKYINENTKYIYIKGAFTSSLGKELSESKYFKDFIIIIENGTKIFVDAFTWKNLIRKGMKIEVLKKINIAAVTVNPISPSGYSFDSGDLIDRISKAFENIKVIDVISGGE